MKVLIIAPHPDDEVIGCGGTIVKHVSSGDRVYLLVMTQVYAPEWKNEEIEMRKQEAIRAAAVLGITEVYFAGFPTCKINTVPTIALVNVISKYIRKIMPEMIYLPPRNDPNVDHTRICQAGIAAAKNAPFIRKIISYEVPTVFRYDGMKTNLYIDISDHFKKKIRAMKEYKSELIRFPHPRSIKGLTILASERGLAIGAKRAEAFQIIREVIK